MPEQVLIATTGYDRIEIGPNGLDSTLTIDQFDPTLGDLQSATFTVALAVETEGPLLGDTQGSSDQTASVYANFRFTIDPLGQEPNGLTGVYSVTAFDPSLPISNFDPTDVSIGNSYTTPEFEITNLAPLIGIEGYTFDIDSRERLLIDVGRGAAGQEAGFDTYSTATITVEYTYLSDTDGGVLSGGPDGNNTIGDSGDNMLSGSPVTDTLMGGAGNDFLDGGAGPDRLMGGTGNDRYYIEDAGDVIIGEIGYSDGGGIDTVYAYRDYTLGRNVEILRLQGSEDLNGGGNWAPESLVGNTGANILDGSGGNDKINGKAGNDVLIGGAGSDTLVGDLGSDTFRFSDISESRAGRDSRDFINGFSRGEDRIDLSGIDASTTLPDEQAFTFIDNAEFSGTAGELRWFTWGVNNFNVIEADVDGDGAADFQIFVNLTNTMTESDFLL